MSFAVDLFEFEDHICEVVAKVDQEGDGAFAVCEVSDTHIVSLSRIKDVAGKHWNLTVLDASDIQILTEALQKYYDEWLRDWDDEEQEPSDLEEHGLSFFETV